MTAFAAQCDAAGTVNEATDEGSWRAELLAILSAQSRNPNRQERYELALDVLAVYLHDESVSEALGRLME